MHSHSLEAWQHDHDFGQNVHRAGEVRTMWVIALTAVMMAVEIAAGMIFGSMALLADGLHMASHAGALAIAATGYVYARRHASDPRFSFGTGKVNSLAGFAGALLLAVFAVIMAWESVGRFFAPIAIAFDEAIAVAVVGLLVNGASVAILGVEHDPPHDQHDAHAHGPHGHAHHDHNLRSAYLHVLADALTSVLAIVALVAGKLFGLGWMDPAMGLVGAVLVSRWSIGLLRETSHVLLDRQAPEELRRRIVEAIEGGRGDRVTDLHIWSIGPGMYNAIVSVVSDDPLLVPSYKERLPKDSGIVHCAVEVQRCTSHASSA
jgi:cation diffusion facilitator family transporter